MILHKEKDVCFTHMKIRLYSHPLEFNNNMQIQPTKMVPSLNLGRDWS